MDSSRRSLRQGIPVSAVAIRMTHMQTPSCFWVHELSCKEVDLLEKDIAKLCDNKISNKLQYQPSNGEIVAVLEPGTKKWVRGLVVKWLPKDKFGDIFLMDYGYTLQHVQHVHSLPSSAKLLKPQSFQIFLAGVLPLANCYNYDAGRFILTLGDSWMPAATVKVKKLLSRSTHYYFEPTNKFGDAMIGNLLMIFPNQPNAISLASTLCDTELAVVDKERFSAQFNVRVNPLAVSWDHVLTSSSRPHTENVHNTSATKLSDAIKLSESTGNLLTKSKNEQLNDTQLGHHGTDFSAEEPAESDAVPKPNFDFLQPLTSKGLFNEARTLCNYRLPSHQKSDIKNTKSLYSGDCAEVWVPQLLDRLSQTTLFIQASRFKPIGSIENAPFHRNVNKALHTFGLKGITNQQKHMWPVILRGQNMVSVGGPETGKTVGFLAPLASQILDFEFYRELNKSVGPLVLILCSNSEKVVTAENWLKRLTKNEFADYPSSYYQESSRIKIFVTYGGCAEKQEAEELITGCHILITTPFCLIRVLDYFKHAVDFNRLCHLVFDDADVLFDHFGEQVHRILSLCQKSLNVEWRRHMSLQVIATCRKWTHGVESFMKCIPKNPAVIVSSGFEVLAYCKHPPMVHTLPTPHFRPSQVLVIAKKHCDTSKTLVVCRTKEEAASMFHLLRTFSSNLLIADESMNQFEIAKVRESWFSSHKPGMLPLLVVTDSVLSEMGVFDATVLINYTWPIMKNVINARVASILDTCLHKFKNDKAVAPEVHIFLDENDGKQTPAIVELLTRMNITKMKCSEDLGEKAEETLRMREEIKSEATLCANLRNFGICSVQRSCPFRHAVVADLDSNPPQVPLVGEVQFKDMEIHSATHFSARLEKHTSPDGVSTDLLTKEHVLLPIEMSQHFGKQAKSNELEQLRNKNTQQFDNKEQLKPSSSSGAKDEPLCKKMSMYEPSNPQNFHRDMAKMPDTRSDLPLYEYKKCLVLNEISGDVFNAEEDVSLAHCVAEDFIMTKGIALQFKEKFGGVHNLLNQRKRTGEVAFLQNGSRFIFCLVIKQRTSFYCLPTITAIKQSLEDLKKYCVKLKVKHLAIPRIGTGNNCLPWKAVKDCIKNIFCDMNMIISVYHCFAIEVKGDIFKVPTQVSMAHCVAEDFKMTKGVALAFRNKFGNVDFLKSQGKRIGEVAVLKTYSRFVFYLVTKKESTFDCKPTLDTMANCLSELRKCCVQYKVSRLAIPKNGTGIDQLLWDDIKELIEKIFSDTTISITVYKLTDDQ